MRFGSLTICVLLPPLLAAPARGQEAADLFDAAERAYWAFQPIRRSPPPSVRNSAWPRNSVDAFVLAKLEAAGLGPAAEADRRTLLRRACFDLLGLPPTEEQSAAFLGDRRPDAYARMIDRLLASPHYGQRWARHWLDLVRYAETDGYNQDARRPHAWRYRDYVVRAFNADKPYDRFITEQLAGDEIAPEDPDALIATGFLRHGPYEYNQRNAPQQRMHILNELTDVAGHVFLGLTLRCARCHDHKFDAILQQDYYRLQAFFTPLVARDDVRLGTPQERRRYEQRLARWEAASEQVRAKIAGIEQPFRKRERAKRKALFTPEIQAMIDKPSSQRTPREEQIARLAGYQLVITTADLQKLIKGETRKRWDALRKELAKFDKLRPQPLPAVMTASDVGTKPPETIIPDDDSRVAPGFLSVLDPSDAKVTAKPASTGRRTALARWLTDRDNPLVARVMANRLWHHHFRRGLVATPNDLGRQGEKCTHPELLDWLASELIDSGWSLKHVHRLMMTSAAYRQASRVRPSQRTTNVDPDNKLLWRMRSGRLEAEVIRDAMLAASGELNPKMAGPSVFPKLPRGISARHGWPPTRSATERNRRSVYLFVKRNLLHPLLDSFDMPDTHESCARRQVTTTAPQALLLLNGDWPLERAAAFAERLLDESSDPSRQDLRRLVSRAYHLAYSRPATEAEISLSTTFLARQAAIIGGPTPTKSALIDFCHVLLNSNELIYVD